MAAWPEPVTLRPLRAGDCTAVTALCLRSKAVWGYDAAFIEACRAELTLDPAELGVMLACVAEAGGRLLGVAQISIDGTEAELEKLFVEPGAIGTGLGRRLFAWAVEAARAAGAGRMKVAADPGAAPFYSAMGAREVGQVASDSIPGRRLPLLALDLV